MQSDAKETIEWVDIGELKPHPKNRNKHSKEQIKRLADIIKYQGWRHPIIVSTLSGYIAAGHGRLDAAKLIGLKKVPVHYQSFQDTDQEYAFLVSDNSIAAWAELDLAGINTDIGDLGPEFDIDLLGIKDFVLEPADKYGDPDDVPKIGTNAICKPGELWILGSHRLLCGDCTIRENVERLMGGEKADMVFTDPPYGIDYDSCKGIDIKGTTVKGLEYKKIEGDAKEFDPSHIFEMFGYCDEIFLFGGDYFVGTEKIRNGSFLVWDKRTGDQDNLPGSHFELCWSKQKHQRRILRFPWVAAFAVERTEMERYHPTQKSISMIVDILCRWGKGKLIWDGYLGSGSTLIACEKTGRRCFGMEIDPIYCDVILDRFQKYSGKEPKREDGTPWSYIRDGGD